MLKAFGPERLRSAADLTRLRIGRGNTAINGPKSVGGGLYRDSVSYLRDPREISEKAKETVFAGAICKELRWPKTSDTPHA